MGSKISHTLYTTMMKYTKIVLENHNEPGRYELL